jgi:predicted enzyme related to lactoylglutathione lyase
MKRIAIGTVISTLAVFAATQPLTAQSGTPSSVRARYLILRVNDLASSIAFYRDRVGLTLESANQQRAVFTAGGVALMIEGVLKPVTAPSTGLAAFTEIVLETPDIFATYASMQQRGVTFRGKPAAVTTDGSRELYATNFRDLDGHIISITGWVPLASSQ